MQILFHNVIVAICFHDFFQETYVLSKEVFYQEVAGGLSLNPCPLFNSDAPSMVFIERPLGINSGMETATRKDMKTSKN